MNMDFERKLAIPMEVKEMYPLTAAMSEIVDSRAIELKNKQDNTLYSMYWVDDLYTANSNAPYRNAYYFRCRGTSDATFTNIERYYGLPIRAIKYPATSSAK